MFDTIKTWLSQDAGLSVGMVFLLILTVAVLSWAFATVHEEAKYLKGYEQMLAHQHHNATLVVWNDKLAARNNELLAEKHDVLVENEELHNTLTQFVSHSLEDQQNAERWPHQWRSSSYTDDLFAEEPLPFNVVPLHGQRPDDN